MKLMLVGSNQALVERVHKRFGAHGVDVIRYSHPIKAMDNIEEVQPNVILFSSSDFPRHWKTFLTFLRGQLYRDRCVFVLLTPECFSEDEAVKALHLGANGLVSDTLADEKELTRLHDLIARYQDLREARSAPRFRPAEHDRVELIATHPKTLQLILGTVRDISVTGLAFIPDLPATVAGLNPGTMLPHGCLRVGDQIFIASLTVLRHDDALTLLFDNLPVSNASAIERYFAQSSERELRAAKRS